MTARLRGFTLIELMVALAIFGILLMLAGPQYAQFMANHQIRNATDSLLNGVQQAQSIAIQRNAAVCLVVDKKDASTTAGGWQIVENDDALGCHEATPPDPAPTNPAPYKYHDGAPNVIVTPVPADATVLRFDGFGRIVANDPASATLTCIKVSHTLSGSRPLNVAISSTGLGVGTKLCDPDPKKELPAGDPLTCPAGCV